VSLRSPGLRWLAAARRELNQENERTAQTAKQKAVEPEL
jgi:hypothetical protein